MDLEVVRTGGPALIAIILTFKMYLDSRKNGHYIPHFERVEAALARIEAEQRRLLGAIRHLRDSHNHHNRRPDGAL